MFNWFNWFDLLNWLNSFNSFNWFDLFDLIQLPVGAACSRERFNGSSIVCAYYAPIEPIELMKPIKPIKLFLEISFFFTIDAPAIMLPVEPHLF